MPVHGTLTTAASSMVATKPSPTSTTLSPSLVTALKTAKATGSSAIPGLPRGVRPATSSSTVVLMKSKTVVLTLLLLMAPPALVRLTPLLLAVLAVSSTTLPTLLVPPLPPPPPQATSCTEYIVISLNCCSLNFLHHLVNKNLSILGCLVNFGLCSV